MKHRGPAHHDGGQALFFLPRRFLPQPRPPHLPPNLADPLRRPCSQKGRSQGWRRQLRGLMGVLADTKRPGHSSSKVGVNTPEEGR
jgi:hypothetical protein